MPEWKYESPQCARYYLFIWLQRTIKDEAYFTCKQKRLLSTTHLIWQLASSAWERRRGKCYHPLADDGCMESWLVDMNKYIGCNEKGKWKEKETVAILITVFMWSFSCFTGKKKCMMSWCSQTWTDTNTVSYTVTKTVRLPHTCTCLHLPFRQVASYY